MFDKLVISGGPITVGALTATTGAFSGNVTISKATPQLMLDATSGNPRIGFRDTTGGDRYYLQSTASDVLAFSDNNAVVKATIDSAALKPATAGGLTLGTTALPWKDPSFGYDASNRVDITISSAGAVTYTAVGASAAHSFASQAVSMGALTASGITVGGTLTINANYAQFEAMTVPASPSANRGRLFIYDNGTNWALAIKWSDGSIDELAVGPAI